MTHRTLLAALVALAPGMALAQDPACAAFPAAATSYSCTCPAGEAVGAVWGSGPYTADSDVCTAARHAGVIGTEGGAVAADQVTPPESYAGTTANGVTTRPYGAYDRAFAIRGAALGVGLATCQGAGALSETTCGCPAGPYSGTVWGSDPYTADSDVCLAAQHAGVIGEAGGAVTFRRVAGQGAYAGSEAHGVTSLDYGSWGSSITFAPKP